MEEGNQISGSEGTVDQGTEANPAAQPAPEATATQGTEPAATPGQDAGKPSTEEKATDSFTKVDVSKLPPELQSVYKSLQADYTRKTQEIAGYRGQLETLAQKAQAYDEIVQSQTNTQADPSAEISDEEMAAVLAGDKTAFAQVFQKMAAAQQATLSKEVQTLQSRLAHEEAARVAEAFFNASDESGKMLNEDAKKLDNIFLDEGTSLLNAFVMLDKAKPTNGDEMMEKLSRASANAKAFYDKIAEQVKAEITASNKAKLGRTSLPAGGSGGQTTSFAGDPSKITPKQALELAMRGVAVR